MNYIPHQLKTDPQITSLKSDYLVIVHPFAKVKRSKSNVYPSTVKLSPLSGVPKIFKSKVPVEIHERCYRDNYMVTAGEKSVFVRRRRSPIDVDAEGFVEVEEQGCVPAGRAGGRGGSGSGGAAAVGAGGAAGADANQNRHHLACQQHFGPHAQFDGVDSCECKDGFSQGADGLCAPDAPAKAGAAGTRGGGGAGGAGRAQFAEFDAQCAQLVANSEFDGVSDCRCKQGFNQVDALPFLISPTWD